MTRRWDGNRMTTQFYTEISKDIKRVVSPLDTLNREEVDKMPKGIYDRAKMKKSKRTGRGRRVKDYIDVPITKREFDLLKQGKRAVKPLNGTGKWISMYVVNSKVEKKIKILQAQINKLKSQLS